MMRRLFSTDDWLAKHQGVCLVCLLALVCLVNVMEGIA